MQREYKNVVFTEHALDRMKLRKLTQEMIASAVQTPDDRQLEADGDTKFIKIIKGRNVQVVGKYLDDEKKWLVKSTWVRGEDDPKPLWVRLITLIFGVARTLLSSKKGRGRR